MGFHFEPYRVCRRAHSERGWSPWHDPVSTPPNYVNAPSGWCSTMLASIRRSGPRFGQWPRRSAGGAKGPRADREVARPSAGSRGFTWVSGGRQPRRRDTMKLLRRNGLGFVFGFVSACLTLASVNAQPRRTGKIATLLTADLAGWCDSRR